MDLEINVSKGYQPPNKNLIPKYLLDIIHDQNMENNLSLIKRDSDIFGFLFLGDIENIYRTPLLNILVSGKNTVFVLEIIDFQGHLEHCGKKYGTFIYNIFLEHMKKMTLIR